MNKKSIAKTAVLYWSDEDNCFLKESPLFESVIGVGDTPEEANTTFSDLLDDAHDAYLAGRVPGYSRPGRPTKGGVALNSDVQPNTKERIKQLAAHLDCSSGEVVDYLLFHWEHFEQIPKAKHNQSNANQLDQLSTRMTALENNLKRIENSVSRNPTRRKRKKHTDKQ